MDPKKKLEIFGSQSLDIPPASLDKGIAIQSVWVGVCMYGCYENIGCFEGSGVAPGLAGETPVAFSKNGFSKNIRVGEYRWAKYYNYARLNFGGVPGWRGDVMGK